MPQVLIDRAIELIKDQRFREALPLLLRAIDNDPLQWNAWYMAGQCFRFLNDIDGAIEHLSHAAELEANDPSILLALGIAFQLKEQWDDAIKALSSAIDIDADFVLAYNSLALTQKKRGELDKALHNYDAGAKALARRIVKAMRNSRANPILKHRDTVGTLWVEYVGYAALYLAAMSADIDGMAWPTAQMALEEEQTERHAGLYWTDITDDEGKTIRLFLPNYFNTFQEELRRDRTYSDLIGNRGTVLELLGRHDEARQHFDEATDFLP